MANHQKFIKYLLSFVIAFSPVLLINSANASTVGGWNLSNPIAQGASTLYNGAKNVIINGKNVAKTSTALVTPVAKDVAKLLGKGVGGVALAFAVEQLIGAVDWVLDPANNQIKYKVPASDPNSPQNEFYYQSIYPLTKSSTMQGSVDKAAAEICRLNKYTGCKGEIGSRQNANQYDVKYTWTGPTPGSLINNVSRSKNPAYNPEAEQEERLIPLDTVAQQVISNAESGDTNAQDVTTAAAAAAADVVAEAEAEKDATKAKPIVNQLEANAETATDETASAESKPKDPAKPEAGSDLSIEFPVFCGWAPTICEAATTVIKLPTTISEYWDYIKTKTSEWESALEDFFKEKTSDKTELEIPTPVPPDIDTNINFSSACPANFTLANFSYHGFSQNWQVDFSKFCDVFGTYVKPVVIAMGAFTAALIIGGVRTNE